MFGGSVKNTTGRATTNDRRGSAMTTPGVRNWQSGETVARKEGREGQRGLPESGADGQSSAGAAPDLVRVVSGMSNPARTIVNRISGERNPNR